MPLDTHMQMLLVWGGVCEHVAAKGLLQKEICFFLWRKLWSRRV